MEVSVQTWLAAICDARRLAFAATGFKRSVNLGFSFKYSHYIAEKSRHQLARIGVQFTADWEPGSGSRHIDPTQWAPIVQRLPEHDSGDKAVPERELVLARFGLLPSFAKDEKYGLCTYNARSKTVATLASVKGIGQRPVTASFPRPASTSLTLPAFDDDRVIAATDRSDIWGVGRRIDAQLREEGLKSALDVMRLDPTVVRRCWSVVLERTIRELQGQSCLAFEDVPQDKQEIAST